MQIRENAAPTATIVMSGATAGIGAQAVAKLRDSGRRIIVGARGSATAGDTTLPLDLASLASAREFAAAVLATTAESGIDALVLNAGAQFADTDTATIDGYERTFAVNHLAHMLLAQLLAPQINDGGRIILTTSDTHDPALFGMGPTELDVDGWARPGTGLSPMRAYAASKLANLLTAQHLAAQPELRQRGITAIGYNPGLTGGTQLQRSQPGARRMMRVMGAASKIVGRIQPHMHMGTPERAGEVLAQLALGQLQIPSDSVYVSLVRGDVTFPLPSKLAQDPSTASDLWAASQRMLDSRTT